MRVAIVHYWLVGMRGGEKVIEALCNLFPEADIFTHVYAPESISEVIRSHKVATTFINKLPKAARLYKHYLPLMPMALERLDLREYDLVISSESGPAKGILPRPGALHVCYCHSPMRYIWNMYQEYREEASSVVRAAMGPLSHYLRMWDVTAATRVDDFIANSETVATRIQRYYRRDATVISPPVSVSDFSVVPEGELGDYHLMVGELVRYKRPDLAVKAFNQTGKKLVVIGGGEMLSELKTLAKSNVTVLGPQPFSVLRHHYSRCRALIFPGEEDFGMVPVEAMASGRPVIAYARGGATETVVPGLSGVLFDKQTVDTLIEAERIASATDFDPRRIVEHAQAFSVDQFNVKMRRHIYGLLQAQGSRLP